MEINYAVGNPATTNHSDGARPQPYAGQQGEVITSDYHGKYYTAAKRGALFHGCGVIAGNSFPLYTTTAFVFGLWKAD